MIQLQNVTKKYKKNTALYPFTFQFNPGQGYGILGMNGAGKSTLIGCITGNLKYEGNISFSELSLHEIGYVPQELAIYPELSVMENLLFFGALFGLPKSVAKKRAHALMNKVGLADKEKEKAKNLSGGMKRKLNVITGLIHQPRYLICDEVCVGIDPISRQEILAYLKELVHQGLGLIYTSHYLDEVEFLCEDILFLHEGKIELQGKKSEISKIIGNGKENNLHDIFIHVIRKEGEIND